MNLHLLLLTVDTICLEVQFVIKQLYCYRNIHVYDFYDDTGHHHRSQCKHWTAFKGQDPSLAWALFDFFWALLETLTFRHILETGKLCSFELWAKFTES